MKFLFDTETKSGFKENPLDNIRRLLHMNVYEYGGYKYISENYCFPRQSGTSTALCKFALNMRELNPDLNIYYYGRTSNISNEHLIVYRQIGCKFINNLDSLRGISGNTLIISDCFTEFANKKYVKEFKKALKTIGIINKSLGNYTVNINVNTGGYNNKYF